MSRCSARFVRRACPGVSMNTAWSEPRFSTPSTRWRVVCGLSVTMLSFSPTSAFSSVDLPTFGRPTIATKPQRPVGCLSAAHRSAPRASPRRLPAPLGGGSVLDRSYGHSSLEPRNSTMNVCSWSRPCTAVTAYDGKRQPPALQPLLQPCFRILERRRIRQALELLGEHESRRQLLPPPRRRQATRRRSTLRRRRRGSRRAARRRIAALRDRASSARRYRARWPIAASVGSLTSAARARLKIAFGVVVGAARRAGARWRSSRTSRRGTRGARCWLSTRCGASAQDRGASGP